MKLFLIAIGLVYSLMAADASEAAKKLGVYNNYEKANTEAKKSDKILVLVIVKNPCPYCDRFVNNTLSDSGIQKELKKYVVGIVDINDVYPKGFKPAMTPVTVFVHPRSGDIVWESMGAVSIEGFKSDLKEATISREEDDVEQ